MPELGQEIEEEYVVLMHDDRFYVAFFTTLYMSPMGLLGLLGEALG